MRITAFNKHKLRCFFIIAFFIILSVSLRQAAAQYSPYSPTLGISPSSGPPSSNVTVSGSNFTPNEKVSVYFGKNLVGSAATAADGSFIATVTVPSTSDIVPGNTYQISATDGKGLTASADFAVTASSSTSTKPSPPSLNVNPSSGQPSSIATVSGSNFTANDKVSIYFGKTLVGGGSTASDGSFAATITIPSTADITPGIYYISATDSKGLSASADFTVTSSSSSGKPLLKLDRSSGPPSSNVTVSGSNFTPNEKVSVYFGKNLVGSAATAADGSFIATVTVPSTSDIVPGNTYQISATDGKGLTASTGFTVTAFAGQSSGNQTGNYTTPPLPTEAPKALVQYFPIPTIKLDPSAAPSGAIVNLYGAHFSRDATLVIYLAGQAVGNATSNSEGWFNSPFIIPSDLLEGKNYLVSANDSKGISASTSLNIIGSVSEPLFFGRPYIIIDPLSASPGSTVTIYGGNFSPDSSVTVYFLGKEVCNTNATSKGMFITSFIMPSSSDLISGDVYSVLASDGNGSSASASLGATSSSTITPPSAPTSTPQGTPKSQCLIATAAFGSELAPQVQFLRNFRDYGILSTGAGSSFMIVFNAWYYSFSPYVANYERGEPWLQQIVRISLYPLLGILTLSERAFSTFPGEFGALSAGLIASSLIGAVYLSPLALSVKQVRKGKINYEIAIAIIASTTVVLVLSIIVGNNILLMIATSLFVLSVLIVSAMLVARSAARIVLKLRERIH